MRYGDILNMMHDTAGLHFRGTCYAAAFSIVTVQCITLLCTSTRYIALIMRIYNELHMCVCLSIVTCSLAAACHVEWLQVTDYDPGVSTTACWIHSGALGTSRTLSAALAQVLMPIMVAYAKRGKTEKVVLACQGVYCPPCYNMIAPVPWKRLLNDCRLKT